MILNDTLYKRGFSMPYLKCVDEEEARYILEEIHGGVCGDHAGSRSLVNKVIRTGYFWQLCRWTLLKSSRSATSAKGSRMSSDFQ